jgi:hypothetical protein
MSHQKATRIGVSAKLEAGRLARMPAVLHIMDARAFDHLQTASHGIKSRAAKRVGEKPVPFERNAALDDPADHADRIRRAILFARREGRALRVLGRASDMCLRQIECRVIGDVEGHVTITHSTRSFDGDDWTARPRGRSCRHLEIRSFTRGPLGCDAGL